MPAKTKVKTTRAKPAEVLTPHQLRVKMYASKMDAPDFGGDIAEYRKAVLGAALEMLENLNESMTPLESLIDTLVWGYICGDVVLEDLVREKTKEFFENVNMMRDEAATFDRMYGIRKLEAA